MSSKASIALSATAILASLGLLSGCGRSHAAVAAAPVESAPEITAAQVIAQPLHHFQEFTGTLQAVDIVAVHARVSGYVDSVQFVEGARVRRGERLFQIDPRPFQDEVDRLTRRAKPRGCGTRLARANHARAEGLIAAARHLARGVRAAGRRARAPPRGRPSTPVSSSLAAARLNREFTEVRAPIDGHVSRALITAGNLVIERELSSPSGLGRLRSTPTSMPTRRLTCATGNWTPRHGAGRRATPRPRRAVFTGTGGRGGLSAQGSLEFRRQPRRSRHRNHPRTRGVREPATGALPRGCSRASAWSAARRPTMPCSSTSVPSAPISAASTC